MASAPPPVSGGRPESDGAAQKEPSAWSRRVAVIVGLAALVVIVIFLGAALLRERQEAQRKRLEAQRLSEFKADARAAVHALDTVQAAIEVGVLYADYAKRVADAKAVVDRFLLKWPVDLVPPLRNSVSQAMDNFALALEVWGQRMKGGSWISEEHELAPRLLSVPGVKTRIEPGWRGTYHGEPDRNVIDLDPAQQKLWAEATIQLLLAREMVRE